VEELLAPDLVHHDPFPGTPPDREGVKQMLALFRGAFPDTEVMIEGSAPERTTPSSAGRCRAHTKWRVDGHTPTGRRFEIPGMHMIRIQGGMIVGEWRSADELALMQQLGVIPAPQQA